MASEPQAGSRSIDERMRDEQSAYYERFHELIDDSPVGRFVHFMNLGYEPLPGETGPTARWAELLGARVQRPEERLVAELVGDGPLTGPLLDVGCGRGGVLGFLRRAWPDVSSVGIDVNHRALTRARVVVPVARADGECLPIASGSCGSVVCVEMSSSTPWPNRLLGEIARVVKRGGWLYFADAVFAADDFVPELLTRLGFEIALDRSVRENVLASCIGRAGRRPPEQRSLTRASEAAEQARSASPDATSVGLEFAFAPGSAAFAGLQAGAVDYRLVRARRLGGKGGAGVGPEAARAAVAAFDAAAQRHQRRVVGPL